MKNDNKFISFRKLEEKDLTLIYNWLNKKLIIEWYAKNPITFDRVKEKYIPYIKNEKPTKAFLILNNDKPIGYIQTYNIEGYPKYKELIGLDEKIAGLDLYIGEEEYIHKRIGSEIIETFLKDYTFKMFDVNTCVIGPEPENKIAIRAYEKSGFTYFKTVNNQNEDMNEYLMRINKEDLINN